MRRATHFLQQTLNVEIHKLERQLVMVQPQLQLLVASYMLGAIALRRQLGALSRLPGDLPAQTAVAVYCWAVVEVSEVRGAVSGCATMPSRRSQGVLGALRDASALAGSLGHAELFEMLSLLDDSLYRLIETRDRIEQVGSALHPTPS